MYMALDTVVRFVNRICCQWFKDHFTKVAYLLVSANRRREFLSLIRQASAHLLANSGSLGRASSNVIKTNLFLRICSELTSLVESWEMFSTCRRHFLDRYLVKLNDILAIITNRIRYECKHRLVLLLKNLLY